MSIITNPNLYTGKINPEIMMPMVLGTNTFGTNAVKLHSDVNGKLVVGKQDVDVVIQDYNDLFAADGDINQNLSDVVLQPVPMMVNMNIPKSQLFTSYMADMLPAGIGINNTTYGPWIAEAIATLLTPKISTSIEQIVWNGGVQVSADFQVTSPPAGAVSQIATQAKASRKQKCVASGIYAATAISAAGVLTVASTANLQVGDVLTITASAGTPQIGGVTIVGQSLVVIALTSTTITTALETTGDVPAVTGSGTLAITFVTINNASVFDAFQTVLKTLPRSVKYATDRRGTELVWVISPNVADAYNTRLLFNGNAQVNYLNFDPTNAAPTSTFGSKTIDVFGMKALVIPGLAPNTMVYYPSDSILVGMDIATETARLLIVDQTPTVLNNVYAVRADWQLDTKITFAEQFSIISPLVA